MRPVFVLSLSLFLPLAVAAATAPPGFNVHVVLEENGRRFLRGGAPRPDTLQALARAARTRGARVTLVDLRQPANKDDQSGKGGRLSPKQEAAAARRLGLEYVQVSALDKTLADRLQAWRLRGDVYIHCMYGMNRTGFAVARFARAQQLTLPRDGLGKRDWRQGYAFESARRK